MVYLVLIHIQLEQREHLGKIIAYIQNELGTANCTLTETKTHFEINCRVSASYLSDVLEKLEQFGVGVEYGIVDVLELTLSIPHVHRSRHKRFAQNGLPLRMVRSTISAGSGLSVDYCLYVIVASFLAGIGLATNNAVTIVASMLVSPLMVPLSGLCFGILMLDWMLILKAMVSEAVGILLCLLTGVVVAFLTVPFVGDQQGFLTQFMWPNEQMTSRGTYESLFTGLLVAIPSGIGVPLSLVGGNVNSLVGVAISAALLPPIVNCGMNLIFGSLGPLMNPNISHSVATDGLVIAGYSLALFVENSLIIIILSIIVLKLKKVGPLRKASKWYKSLPTLPPPGMSLIPRSFSVYNINQHHDKKKRRTTASSINLEDLKAEEKTEQEEKTDAANFESILDKVPYIETELNEDDLQSPSRTSPPAGDVLLENAESPIQSSMDDFTDASRSPEDAEAENKI